MQIASFTIVKNMAATVGLMIESLTWVDKIIIYDDGSTDSTLEIVKQMMSNFGMRHKIIVLQSQNTQSIFEIGELLERNRLLKYVFDNYIFDFVVLVDADELMSANLKEYINNLYQSEYENLALSCYHIYDKNSYLHFFENNWNGVEMIDPHVRVLSKYKAYEKGLWADVQHPWLPFNNATKCINYPLHFHLKYIENSPYINTSLSFLPQRITKQNSIEFQRDFIGKLPPDIQNILNKLS